MLEIIRTLLEIFRTWLEIIRTVLEIIRTVLEIIRTVLEIIRTVLDRSENFELILLCVILKVNKCEMHRLIYQFFNDYF